MRNNSFFKIILIALTVVFFTSCDKDFNSIGSELIGNEHFGLVSKKFDVISYNQKVGPVQSNNLPVNALGIYEDGFGTTEASFVTQVTLATVNPTIDPTLNQEIENVILTVPYFSERTDTNLNIDDFKYRLDSIYGPAEGVVNLSVYENGYFMRDLDPATGFLQPQRFYSNQGSEFEALKKATLLNDSIALSQNKEFFFDAKGFKETVTTNGVDALTAVKPQMRLSLNKAYFKTKIIDAVASGKLLNNDVFKDYFRGLYFKVEKSGSKPSRLAMLNFALGKITINYKENTSATNTARIKKSIVLNLTGNTSTGLICNTVNLLSTTNKTEYANATNPSVIDTVSGDPKLYLKGGEGAMAVLNLFNKTDVKGFDANGILTVGSNGVPDELDDLRNPEGGKKLLINEANLVFHIDQATMGLNVLPKRVYLYDLTNNTPVVDYLDDQTTTTNSKNAKLIYNGILNTTNKDDNTYRIRITNHIRNLIVSKTAVNIKLGVVVTEDINNSTMNLLKLPLPTNTTLTRVPQASVMSPLGVVFYGGTTAVSEDKRLKLEIYYTKPN